MVLVLLNGQAAWAGFSVGSAVSSKASFSLLSEHDNTLSRPTDDPLGIDEVFGTSPSIDPVQGGLVATTSNGRVFFYRRDSISRQISTSGELVHHNPDGWFVPAAVCGGIVAVAEGANL